MKFGFCQNLKAPRVNFFLKNKESKRAIMTTLVSKSSSKFIGKARIPGDKSISHRALLLAALAPGMSQIEGLLESEDVLNTKKALAALGVKIKKNLTNFQVAGVGTGGLKPPKVPLDFGNSGTGARLMMGLLAGCPFAVRITGDSSLVTRPMARILAPLCDMGAMVDPKGATTLPFTLTGSANLRAIDYVSKVPSAQVKSAILLAALGAAGETSVVERLPTRDHTERLLAGFGAKILKETGDNGSVKVIIKGRPVLRPQSLVIPGDFSAAAFLIVAALTVPGSKITLKNVGVNPLRTGLLDVLATMGANLEMTNQKNCSGEPVADLLAGHSSLSGIKTSAAIAPRMIDEFPILFVAAALAKGISEFRGLQELRLKESDRLKEMAQGLTANGVEVEELSDGLKIKGLGGMVPGGGMIDAHHDHRIAMAFLVLGLRARNPVTVRGAESISTSFPGFAKLMTGLGANIKDAE